MTKSNAESSKSAKRKGTRSVSTLTPSQLARKRANDREAQRAIRARTKEHIENLERELEELRRTQNRDDTLQDLMKRNQQLESELHRLRESMGLPTSAPSSSYPHSSYNSPGSTASSYVAGDVASYDGLPPSSDPWTPAVSCSIPSTVSSPSSSGADDFGPGYYPTSAPALMDRSGYASSMGSPTISCIGGKMGYEELEPDMACPPLNMNALPSGYPPHQVAWNVYPAMYYQASPTL